MNRDGKTPVTRASATIDDELSLGRQRAIRGSIGKKSMVRRTWRFPASSRNDAVEARRNFSLLLSSLSEPRFDVEAGESIFGELVANAILHGRGGDVLVGLSIENGRGRLTVTNEGPAFEPRPRLPADRASEGGRGLYLVARLARGLRVEGSDDECRVIVSLPLSENGKR